MTIGGWLADANIADAASVVGRMGHALRVDGAGGFIGAHLTPNIPLSHYADAAAA